MSLNSDLHGAELITTVLSDVQEELPVARTGNSLLDALQSLDHGLFHDLRNPACLSLSLRLAQ